MSDTNGNGNGTVYVSFGPKETQEIRLEVAQEMLTNWCARQPVQFGRMLAEVQTGVAPKGR